MSTDDSRQTMSKSDNHFHIIGATKDDTAPFSTGQLVPRRRAAVATLLMLAIGLLIGWTLGSSNTVSSDDTEVFPPVAISPTATPTTALWATSSSSTGSSAPVAVTSDAPWLRAPIALAMVSSGAIESLWVVEDDGALVRYPEVPEMPGAFGDPLVFLGDRFAFAGMNQAYFIYADENPEVLGEGSVLVRGATPDRMWLFGDREGLWVRVLDTVSGESGQRIEVSSTVALPLSGVAQGLLVAPVDRAIFGPIAYWVPGLGIQRLDVGVASSTRLVAAAGDIAVFASDSLGVDVVNVAQRTLLAAFEVDLDKIATACLSPQQRWIVFLDGDGQGTVVSTRDGSVLRSIAGPSTLQQIAWTDDLQLLSLVRHEDSQAVEAMDVFTGTTKTIARLAGVGSWRLVSGVPGC